MWNLNFEALSYNTLCSQKKIYVFLMWDKKPFDLNIST